jgi:hypothetical protein
MRPANQAVVWRKAIQNFAGESSDSERADQTGITQEIAYEGH